MKKIFTSLLLLFISSSILFADITDIKVDFQHKSDAVYKQKRREYINYIHSPDSNFNWRIVEQENRMLRQLRLKERFSFPIKKLGNGFLSGEIADGSITGYWRERGSQNQAGRTHTSDIDFDRNYIYTASSGGNIWRKNINLDNWECLNNNYKFTNITMLRVIKIDDKYRIIISCNNKGFVYYSDNEGKDWSKAEGMTTAAFASKYCKRCVIAADGDIYTLIGNNNSTIITKSEDDGNNFKTIASFPQDIAYVDIWTSRYQKTDLYCIAGKSFLKINSEDQQEQLNQDVSFNQTLYGRTLLSGSYNNGSLTLGVAFPRTDSTFFVTSDDGGYNWTRKGSLIEKSFMENSFTLSSVNSNIWYFGGVEFYYSKDCGETWERQNKWVEYYSIYGGNENINLHADIPGINSIINPAGKEYLLINTDGGTYESHDFLETLRNISLKNLNISQYYSTYTEESNESMIFAGSQDQGFQISANTSGIINFNQVISGDYAHICSRDSGNTIWTVYPGMLLNYYDVKSDKYGYMTYNLNSTGNSIWLPPLAPVIEHSDQVYIANSGENKSPQIQKVKTHKDGKYSLTTIISLDGFSNVYNPITAISANPHQKNSFYFITHQGMLTKVIDGQIVYTQKTPRTQGHYLSGNKILISKLDSNKLIVAGSGYSTDGVVVTNDGGKTFNSMTEGLPKTTVIDITQTPDEKYYFAATSSGAYVYVVENKRWYEMAMPDSPDQTFWSVQYLPQSKTARFGTYGRGIWDFNIESFNSIDDNVTLPQNFVINAYPNPAKITDDFLNLKFTLKSTSYCDIRCYDAIGNLIKEDVNLLFEAGENQINYNLDEIKLSKGYYLIFIQTKDYCSFVKVVIE